MFNVFSKYKNVVHWAEKIKEEFYNDIWFDKRLGDNWNIEKAQLKEEILNLPEQSNFTDFCKLVYIHHLIHTPDKSDDCLIGDKNPIHSLFTRELIKLFAEAKFIFVTRDPRDNILSYKNVNFDSNDTAVLAIRWELYNRRILKYSRKFPHKFHLVKYEDLIKDPGTCLQDVCQFLDVQYQDKMLDFYKTTEIKREWHGKLQEPIDINNLEKWKNNLSVHERKIIEYLCRGSAKALNYQLMDSNLPWGSLFRLLKGILVGRLFTFFEKIIFFIPLKLRSSIILWYRMKTGSYKKK